MADDRCKGFVELALPRLPKFWSQAGEKTKVLAGSTTSICFSHPLGCPTKLAQKAACTSEPLQTTQTPSRQPNPRRIACYWIAKSRSRPCENESPHMNAANPDRRPATEEISGVIERVTFHNDDSGFCVLRVKARGQRDETTVVGSLPSVTAGEWLSAEGWWVRDKEHGLQFKLDGQKTVP